MNALTEKDLLNLTEEQARRLVDQGAEATIWALLKLAALARQNAKAESCENNDKNTHDPATPSSQIPPYKKPPPKKRPKIRGRKKGHPGAKRKQPPTINERQEHTLDVCPDCGQTLGAPSVQRQRVIEDIKQTEPVAAEHTIHRYWCRRCKKRVEPRVPQALPGATIGHRAAALTAWLHYGLGQTTSQIVEVLAAHFRLPLTAGGLSQLWLRMADILAPWHEEIARQARRSAVLSADETGWRVNGKTHWLWCFTNADTTWYTIDRSRSAKVVREFLADAFSGTLVTDFYGAYNLIADGERQYCLAHLLREIKKTSKENASEEWRGFAKKLKRLLRDALRLASGGREHPDFASRVTRLHRRLDDMTDLSLWTDRDCRRLSKRLDKARYGLFLFLDDPSVPADNNRAEREIRPAVIARKNSFHNTSESGARAQAIFMSLYRTLKLRGHDPLETIADALTIWTANGGMLPQLPRPPGD